MNFLIRHGNWPLKLSPEDVPGVVFSMKVLKDNSVGDLKWSIKTRGFTVGKLESKIKLVKGYLLITAIFSDRFMHYTSLQVSQVCRYIYHFRRREIENTERKQPLQDNLYSAILLVYPERIPKLIAWGLRGVMVSWDVYCIRRKRYIISLIQHPVTSAGYNHPHRITFTSRGCRAASISWNYTFTICTPWIIDLFNNDVEWGVIWCYTQCDWFVQRTSQSHCV